MSSIACEPSAASRARTAALTATGPSSSIRGQYDRPVRLVCLECLTAGGSDTAADMLDDRLRLDAGPGRLPRSCRVGLRT
jgi:hypothetical protein